MWMELPLEVWLRKESPLRKMCEKPNTFRETPPSGLSHTTWLHSNTPPPASRCPRRSSRSLRPEAPWSGEELPQPTASPFPGSWLQAKRGTRGTDWVLGSVKAQVTEVTQPWLSSLGGSSLILMSKASKRDRQPRTPGARGLLCLAQVPL